jgi:hypothetical protein
MPNKLARSQSSDPRPAGRITAPASTPGTATQGRPDQATSAVKPASATASPSA